MIRAIGGGVERVGGRLRRDMLMRKAEAADATKKAEETAAENSGVSNAGRGVSVPDGVPNGGVFLGGNGGFYRNVDGVPAPISDAEAAKILNQINQSDGEANGGLSGQGDNLNDNSNGGKSVSLGYENAPVVEMPLDKLKLSADVPNFKEGADENGVVSGQRLQGKYERVGTAPIVVWERENGDTEVITGRHRLDLARRSGEKSIPAYVVREADGFTVDDARTFDAESNIRDGMGTVRDYAHFFRNKDIDEAEASGKGLLSREKGKRGWAIGKFAEDNLYWLYRNGGISEERAAAVARGAPNDADVQNAALDSAKGMDATTLEIHTRRLKAFKDESGGNATGEAVQGDLFGVDDSAMREMVALSKAAGELVKQNKQRILAVKGVIKRPEIAREMGVDINNPDAVRAAVAALEYENSRLMSPTPEPEIMDKIRKKAGLFDKSENGENIEQGAGVENQEDTGGLFDDGTAEMSFNRAVKKNPTVLEKLVSAPPVSIAADAYKGKYELNAKSAFRYVMDNLRGKKYTILDTGEQVEISSTGAKEIVSHDRFNEAYLKTFVEIPEIIRNGIFIGERPNEKANDKYKKYRYYVCGLKIGNEDFTIRFAVGERSGKWYYDQALTKMEKGELLEKVHKLTKPALSSESPYITTDKRLLELLQEKISEKEINSAWENVDSVIEAAEREVYAEQKAAVSDADKRIEADKQKFFSEGIDGIEETGDEYSREWYEQNRFRDGETYVGEYVSPNFGDDNIVAVDVDGRREYKTYVGEGVEYNGTFDSIENAARDLLGRAWNEKFEEQGGRSYYEDSEADNSKPDVNRRCFEKAMERLGIKIVRRDFARTGSEYLYLELPNGETMKARFADHKQVYSADISVEDDWKAAVKYVVDVAHKWNDEYKEGNVRFSRGAAGKASSGGNVGGGVSFGSMVEEYAKLRELREKTVGEKPLTFVRPVSAMRSALPKSVRFNKADNRLEGVPSIGDIRRYMERVFNVPIANGLRKEVRQRGALGVYYNRLEAIRTLRGHVNDLDTVAHELGHYLETLFFGGKLASEEVKDFALAKELEDYCIERFGEFAYKGRERIGEGWAQFISDVIKGDETVADRCPRAFAALNSALRESPRVNEAFGFICQMAELNANASPLQRVNANIRRRSDGVRKTAVDRLIESGRWFTRMWFDEYEGLERFQRDLERSGVSEEDGSRVINLARNYAGGSVGQVNYSLTVNQIDLDGRIVGKSLRSILRDNLKSAYDKENIDAYLMCRRVVEYYKTEERRGERAGSRGKFGIDYADAVDVVSTATDGMRRCAEELDVYIFIAKFPADLLLIISVLPFSSAVAFLPRFTDFPPTDSVASSEK